MIEQEIRDKERAFYEARQSLKDQEKELIDLKTNLRQETIAIQFAAFVQKQEQEVGEAIYLNNVLLHAAVKSYYYDIHRYKNFSGSEWANSHKQAAYSIKWIAKFRPIQIKESTKIVSEKLFDINLIFAMVCGFSFLDKQIVDAIMRQKEKIDSHNMLGCEKKCSFFDNLLYALRYRPLSGKQLMFNFETLELALNK